MILLKKMYRKLRSKKDVQKANFKNIEDKISDITNLATKASLHAEINEVKGKIPNITNLAATSALTAVENKIPSVSNLVRETDYNTKINEIEKKITDYNYRYITTLESNKFAAVLFALRLKRTSIVRKVIMLISYEIQILIVN